MVKESHMRFYLRAAAHGFLTVIMITFCMKTTAVAEVASAHSAGLSSSQQLQSSTSAAAGSHDASGSYNNTSLAHVAFVLLATDTYSKQLKCEAAVESLRYNGHWHGSVVLLTDSEGVRCFQHERWSHCGLGAQIVVVNSSALPPVRYPLAGGDVEHKTRVLKTSIFDLLQGVVGGSGRRGAELDGSSLEVVVFVDCDVLVGAPVADFLVGALPDLASGSKPLLMFSKQAAERAAAAAPGSSLRGVRSVCSGGDCAGSSSAGGGSSSNTGGSSSSGKPKGFSDLLDTVWAVHRDHSRELLQAWRDAVLAHPDHSEVHALQNAMKALHPECSEPQQLAALQQAAQAAGQKRPSQQQAAEACLLRHVGMLGSGLETAAGGAASGAAAVGERRLPRVSEANSVGLHDDDDFAASGAGSAPAAAGGNATATGAPGGGWLWRVSCRSPRECARAAPAVFNHVPSATCFMEDQQAVQQFVDDLDLCVFQGLSYCLPRWMAPFWMAWLPYPSCSKMELGITRLTCQWACTDTTFMRTSSHRTSVSHVTLVLPKSASKAAPAAAAAAGKAPVADGGRPGR